MIDTTRLACQDWGLFPVRRPRQIVTPVIAPTKISPNDTTSHHGTRAESPVGDAGSAGPDAVAESSFVPELASGPAESVVSAPAALEFVESGVGDRSPADELDPVDGSPELGEVD
jgi:hypothetical protein